MRRFVKRVVLSGALLSAAMLSFAQLALADTAKVASSLPVLHALNLELLAGTDIEAVYLPPKRLPVKRIPNWLQRKSAKRIEEVGAVDVLVTVESVWPKYTLYPRLRSENIRIIPVDVATELNVPGTRIRYTPEGIKSGHYFWLAPDNLLVMSQILTRDLSTIWPDQAAQIKKNQQQVQQQIQSFALQLDQRMMDNEFNSICLLNAEMAPLAQATFLPLEDKNACSEDALRIGKLGKKNQPLPGHWWLNPAERPLKGNLAQWFADNLSQFDAAIERLAAR